MRLKAGSRAEGFKSHRGRSEKKLEKPLDKPHRMCYNECVKRRGKQKPSLAMVEQKSSKSLLTNGTRCAIIKTLPRENIKQGSQPNSEIGE